MSATIMMMMMILLLVMASITMLTQPRPLLVRQDPRNGGWRNRPKPPPSHKKPTQPTASQHVLCFVCPCQSSNGCLFSICVGGWVRGECGAGDKG